MLSAADTAARNGAGWDACLAALDARAHSRSFERPQWKELYQAYVDAGVPSGAPVPGMD
ncbi:MULTISPECIES: hypothetical protein [Streptomyces]|uniref:hypothetical protein n=1 Tax=Streptomyces TaxID=1883 RepID=UPI000A84E805|nr:MULTISPECIES: hypothetical protein [Streptomyces]MDI5906840.1 hypothetical protein [Streptomyces sp. 12257]